MKLEEEICLCNRCYSDKTPLIFPFNGQKIVFISESPWDFPQKDETVNDFKEKTLPYCISKCAKKHIYIPYNIFEFLIQTFNVNRSNIPEFFKTVYWTHIAKRTLKHKTEEQKRKCAQMCISSTNRELEKINMELLVTATHIGMDLLFKTTLTRAFKKQAQKIERTGELLTNRELGYMALQKNFKVAVFPNPSPINRRYKKLAYIENKGVTEKILERIHTHLPQTLTKPRDVKLTDFGKKNRFD